MTIAWRILRTVLKYPVRISLIYVLSLISVGLGALSPWLFGEAIDTMVAYDPTSGIGINDFTVGQLAFYGIGILAADMTQGTLNYVAGYLVQSVAHRVGSDYRVKLYDKLQNAGMSFYDNRHTGDLISRVNEDVSGVQLIVERGTTRFTNTAVRLLVVAVLLLVINWQLVLVGMIFVPIIAIRSFVTVNVLRDKWVFVQRLNGRLMSVLHESLSNTRLIKAFASEDYERAKFNRNLVVVRDETYGAKKIQGMNHSWMSLYFMISTGIIFWFGGWLVIQQHITPGELATFLLYMAQVRSPVRALPYLISVISRAIASGQRLFAILDSPSVTERPGARVAADVRGHVQFHDVSFVHGGSEVLHNINLEITPGQMVAVIGASGSGKTSLADLLLRFYDVSSGRITLDDLDIRDYTLKSLRGSIGVVHQESYIFNASICDNITYGAADASDEDIEHVAKSVQLHDYITSLPDGYSTVISEGGTTLSGGQRQRLSLARILITNPPVLVLDDSTSNVDVKTEQLIYKALKCNRRNLTTIVITSRTKLAEGMDQIVVLDDGVIVEQGTHTELMCARGVYCDLHAAQSRE